MLQERYYSVWFSYFASPAAIFCYMLLMILLKDELLTPLPIQQLHEASNKESKKNYLSQTTMLSPGGLCNTASKTP